jgi:hypothetical protein
MNFVTVELVLAVLALLLTIAAGVGRAPVWIPVLLLCILALVKALPAR